MTFRLRKPLLVAMIATAVALGLAELVVRLFFHVQVQPVFREFDPVHLWRNKRDFSGRIVNPEFTITLTLNARGFREPTPPPALDGSVLFLGDSFTEGFGVNDGEDYPSLIRDALDRRYGAGVVPVVNAGLTDSGTGRWLTLLRSDLSEARPRLVVLQMFRNDVADNSFEGLFSLSPTGELVQHAPEPPSLPVRAFRWLVDSVPGLESSHVIALTRMAVRHGGHGSEARHPAEADPTTDHAKRALRLTTRILEECLAVCRARGCGTAVVTIDVRGRLQEETRAACEKHGARLVEIDNRAQRPDLYYPVDGHWNAAGHRFHAELLVERLLGADSPYLAGVK